MKCPSKAQGGSLYKYLAKKESIGGSYSRIQRYKYIASLYYHISIILREQKNPPKPKQPQGN